ncbi:MAG: response regulator [Pirellulales bacterium]
MSGPFVCVIDDDPGVAALSAQVLSEAGFEVRTFLSADEFLKNAPQTREPDCVVSDLRMPGIGGGELLRHLKQAGAVASVVIVTAHADVRTTVRLMEDGAASLLEKPFDPPELVEVVRRAVENTVKRRAEVQTVGEIHRRLAQLPADSQAVLECILAGLPNKAIVSRLDISPRTLDRRKQLIMTTLQVGSVPELIALVTRARQ